MASKKATEVLIVSCPKAGRTWLSVMLMKLYHDKVKTPLEFSIFDVDHESPEEIDIPLFIHHYMHPDVPQVIPMHLSERSFVKNKVVLLIRDPRDIAVSYFFQLTKRSDRYSGDISSFLRDSQYGLPRIISFYNMWLNEHQRAGIKDFMFVRYEDLKSDPETAMTKLMQCMHPEHSFDQAAIEDAVQFASFESMKKMEREQVFAGGKLAAKDVSNEDTYKVRRGKVGGYTDYFSDADIAFASRVIRDLDNRFGYSE